MPEIRLTEEQLERLDAVRADVEAAYVGRYGRVTTTDALEYLLDTYAPPSEREDGPTGTATGDGTKATSNGSSNGSGAAANGGASNADGKGEAKEQRSAKPSGGGSPLAAVAALLEDNDDVWRESDGDAPYEVDLPDGSTEGVRTKDDVKRLLFKHYR